MQAVTGFIWVCHSFRYHQGEIPHHMSHLPSHLTTSLLCPQLTEQMLWMGPSTSKHSIWTLTISHFVPNLTMGAPILEHVHKNIPEIYMDCHMMVSDPARVSRYPISFYLCLWSSGYPRSRGQVDQAILSTMKLAVGLVLLIKY
jgi:hypothetical protein